MTTSFERIREAAKVVREIPGASMQGYIDYTADILDEWAANVEADAERDKLAQRLRDAYTEHWTTTPAAWDRIKPESREGWRAVAREAMTAAAEAVAAPATIPVDATGLKGKRARVVGPLADLHAGRGFQLGAEVRIDWDSPNTAGYLACSILGPDGRRLNAPGAASSLALIPDEPEVPVPPVGTRLRDRDGLTWERYSFGWSHDPHRLPRTWGELLTLGPLHQVWERIQDIPTDVRFRGRNDTRDYYGLVFKYTDAEYAKENKDRAPFVAVTEFGADQ